MKKPKSLIEALGTSLVHWNENIEKFKAGTLDWYLDCKGNTCPLCQYQYLQCARCILDDSGKDMGECASEWQKAKTAWFFDKLTVDHIIAIRDRIARELEKAKA